SLEISAIETRPGAETIDNTAKTAQTSLPASLEEKGPFTPTLWRDPDVRWLTGVHTASGHDYLVKEPFEELLWWLQLPALLKFTGRPGEDRSTGVAITKAVDDAIGAVAAAGYQADRLLAFDRRQRKDTAAKHNGTEPRSGRSEAGSAVAASVEEAKPLEPTNTKKG
ncbi:MAG: hypothetical protein WAN28_11080, partial [Terracidiphilus sp.]